MKASWNKKECLIIAVAWLLVYASDPLYMLYAHIAGSLDFSWLKVFDLWKYTTAFLVLFLIHHFLLIPFLASKKQKWGYIASVSACLIAFTAYLICLAPKRGNYPAPLEEKQSLHMVHKPQKGNHPAHWAENKSQEHKTKKEHRPHMREERIHPGASLFLSPPDLARVVMALMLVIADLGAVAWHNDQKLRQRLLQLEKQALKQELTHLRYQINPHFFMNTLNNIHALVDIDQERAKRAIVELSGMMRYSLYEGNETLVPLQHEVEFLRLYISLMKLRFGNKVLLKCDLPDSTPTKATIPPLLLATFVENAFKHGISYQNPSFISIYLALEGGQIHFLCDNSRHNSASATKDGHHGIGLTNVRKRLDLQYTDRYSLIINDDTHDHFLVDLTLPTI